MANWCGYPNIPLLAAGATMENFGSAILKEIYDNLQF